MSILSSIVDVISGGVGGSILGVGGALATKYLDSKTAKATGDLELEKLRETHKHDQAMAGFNLQGKDYETLAASIESDKATYSPGSESRLLQLADFIRAIVRPWLTVFLISLCAGFAIYIFYTHSVKFTEDQLYSILDGIVLCLLNSTSLALSWWFGARKFK